jgi:hypothetical protein
MIAVTIGTDYGPEEKKVSTHVYLFFLRAGSYLFCFWVYFAGKLEHVFFLNLVTKERYPLIGYPHFWLFFAVCFCFSA